MTLMISMHPSGSWKYKDHQKEEEEDEEEEEEENKKD